MCFITNHNLKSPIVRTKRVFSFIVNFFFSQINQLYFVLINVLYLEVVNVKQNFMNV